MENYEQETEKEELIENIHTEKNEKKKMYETLKNFFKSDMKIKEKMLQLAPTQLDDYNEETRIEYTDRIDKFLKETEYEMSSIVQDFNFGPEVRESIKMHFDKAKESLLIGFYRQGIGENVYRKQISSMNEKLIEEVKDKFVGYTLESTDDLAELINKSRSINELLHVLHSYIINNDEILQSMPTIDAKENKISGEPITLYGEQTELSKKIFNDFPLELDCGFTDIISMQNKILMMIRDRGHALTIEIDDMDKTDDVLVKYFVPKLCNEEMIKELRGINKISPNGATGIFESKREELSKQLFDFIEKVPTDADMPSMYSSIQREDIKFEETIKEEAKQDEATYLFEKEDAKEMAMEIGENGRRTGLLAKLEEQIKNQIHELKSNFKVTDEKETGGEDNDRTSRD